MAGAGRLLLTQGDFWQPAANKYLKANKFPKLQEKASTGAEFHRTIPSIFMQQSLISASEKVTWAEIRFLLHISGLCLSLGKAFKLQVILSAKSRFTGARKCQAF